MSKAVVSYYDWKLSFNRRIDSNKVDLNDNDSINTLGIPKNNFKDFMNKWKEKNLS
ncbi:MAG: hypothetical protein ACFFBC_11955 [Promethearchaeota archaeon]